MLKNYIKFVREGWKHREQIADDVLYEADYFAKFEPGTWIRPTLAGARLYALWQILVMDPICEIKYLRCKHENMIDESWGGPESGGVGGSCPDCNFSFSQTMY